MSVSVSRRQALAASCLAIPALALVAQRAAARTGPSLIGPVVDRAVRPVMEKNRVPGMAVAVTIQGQRSLFYYGVASKESGQRVTENTLFEIGSLSKTFTATLAGLAQARGRLILTDKASRYLPALAGSRSNRISLLDLATYTAGGLPLQFPNKVTDQDQMIAYFKTWRPSYGPGTRRLYSNPSIGLFGYIAAASLGAPFDDLMEQQLFPSLGLTRTFIRVPPEQMIYYAYGYGDDDKPIRVHPGVLASEAYGIKTTASDLIRFVEANMGRTVHDERLQRAIDATHIGYYSVDGMTQGLGWEMLAWPTRLSDVRAANSAQMLFDAREVTKLIPPRAPRTDVLINKTGSTGGFGAYAAFVPKKQLGVAILANRSFPIEDRVTAAYAILNALADRA